MAVTMKVNSILGCAATQSGTYRVIQEESTLVGDSIGHCKENSSYEYVSNSECLPR
jgi:hypothetical protein